MRVRIPAGWPAAVVALAAALSGMTGCGGGNGGSPGGGSKPQASSDKSAEEPQPRSSSGEPEGLRKSADTGPIRVDSKGRKWIGEVPLDVWFDDPVGIANQQVAVATPVAPAPAGTNVTPMPMTDTPMSQAPTPATGGAGDWGSLIPTSVVEAEVKTIQNQLTARLRNVGEYKKEFKEIQWDASALSAMGSIAGLHSDPVSWKDKAKYVRHIGSSMEQSAQENNKESFDKTNALAEQLKELLSGGKPADLAADVPEQVPFAESADRYGLMKRINRGYSHLKSNINTAERLKSDKESAIHEAAVLAALSEAIRDEGYLSADEETYQEYAKAMAEAGRQMQAAAEAEDFDAYSAALDTATKCCSDCHGKHKDV